MSQIKAGALFDIKEPPRFDKTTALTVNKEQSGTPPAQESQAATREISAQPSKPSVTERNPNGTLTDAAVAAAREQLAGLTVSGSAKNGNTPQPGTQIGRITEAFVTEVNRLTANLPGGSKASIQETSTGLSARIAPPPGVAAQKAPVRDR